MLPAYILICAHVAISTTRHRSCINLRCVPILLAGEESEEDGSDYGSEALEEGERAKGDHPLQVGGPIGHPEILLCRSC